MIHTNNRVLAYACILAVVLASLSVVSSECDVEKSTICKFENQSFACCHSRDATCCESGEYCCPHGFACDLPNGRCVQNDMFIPFYLKMDLVKFEPELEPSPLGKDILCPDNVTLCKEKQTCCNMTTGGFGCCPIKDVILVYLFFQTFFSLIFNFCFKIKAHCCEDGVHW